MLATTLHISWKVSCKSRLAFETSFVQFPNSLKPDVKGRKTRFLPFKQIQCLLVASAVRRNMFWVLKIPKSASIEQFPCQQHRNHLKIRCPVSARADTRVLYHSPCSGLLISWWRSVFVVWNYSVSQPGLTSLHDSGPKGVIMWFSCSRREPPYCPDADGSPVTVCTSTPQYWTHYLSKTTIEGFYWYDSRAKRFVEKCVILLVLLQFSECLKVHA